MTVSCIIVSHSKPQYCCEAIESVIAQTYQDWQLLVMDSGVLADQGYFSQWESDPRIQMHWTHETEQTRRTRAMAPFSYNEAFNRGLVRGELIVMTCDDDLLLPCCFETYVRYAQENPSHEAWYSSQELVRVYSDGRREQYGERRAQQIGGSCCQGMRLDCVVDGSQLCIRKSVLGYFPHGAVWCEARDHREHHADGILLEEIGSQVPIYPIDVKCTVNRRTPLSKYGPTS